MNQNILEVRDLKTYFFTRWGVVRAVDGISFSLEKKGSLGLVGESGCGKSITAKSILRLVPRPAGRIMGGEVIFEGEDLLKKTEREISQKIRGKKIFMILQDPSVALNPVFTIGDQISEAFIYSQSLKKKRLMERVIEVLSLVGISTPEVRIRQYPFQLSGGMKQRVIGAMGIACHPSLIIADEATTNLDVTIQAQFLELLKDLQEKFNLSLMFITHNLGLVAKMCNKVAVMYAGKIVEFAEVRRIFDNARHPYTEMLLECIPNLEGVEGRLVNIPGQAPKLHQLPTGCSFWPRCSKAKEICRSRAPSSQRISDDHWVSCWGV